MDQLFLKDNFTKSSYFFVDKNKPETINLTDNERQEVDRLHADCKNNLLTLFERVDFNYKTNTKKQSSQFKLSKEEQDIIYKDVLIKLSVKDEQVQKLGNESPYDWFLLEENQIRYSIKCLDDELKKDGFFDRPIDWLIRRGIIRSSKCFKCLTAHQAYDQHADGLFYWICTSDCPSKLMELVDSLSACSKIIKQLPLIIYNWSIFGNSGLVKQTKFNANKYLDSNTVRLTIEALRLTCQMTNDVYIRKLGEDGRKVELYCCTASNLFIVFAFELDSSRLKFRIMNEDEIGQIVGMFKDWFVPDVNLVVYEKKFEFLNKYFSNLQLLSYEHNSEKFLNTVFKLIAHNILPGKLSSDLFSSFLHEITWRILFGQTPYSTFQHIISLIVHQPCSEYDSYMQNLASRPVSDVLIDEVYYGNFDQIRKLKTDPTAELRNNVRCHQCFVPFNFVTISNHIISHFTIKSRKKGAINTTCNHCFSKFSLTELQSHRDLLNGNYKKKNLISCCKICCKIFKTQREYVDHLKEYHKYQDHPYSCVLCPFRTSFYHEKIQHYKRNHPELVKAYCKYCLQIFIDPDSSEQLFAHFKSHIEARDKFDCDRCSLSFISEAEFKSHFLRDHIIQSKKAVNFEVTKYKPENKEEENVLKIKVPKNIPINKIPVQKRTRDGRKVRLTKKNFLKLRCEEVLHDNILNKDFIVFENNLVMCLECSQPIDTNHLSKKAMKCNKCDFTGHCVISIKYPCDLHFSGCIKQSMECNANLAN